MSNKIRDDYRDANRDLKSKRRMLDNYQACYAHQPILNRREEEGLAMRKREVDMAVEALQRAKEALPNAWNE